ncbi:HlyD family type I secretion periplasmic adaptor subunit [Fusibacter sp. 3D3]|uniref:HlyD family type I secretion periplasmic adaptor subunit n=1 Tax=Fusibacter sp. 3D3 TaxID=1048380 RepID=UPI000853EE81|nr:HlyD family type I secretion periplasmic adaptor subunit [Fusibacter sp. 3D3]GAU75503.1 type I secretion membrane fusion protein HlyD [Fusibacter sp. 3D3]
MKKREAQLHRAFLPSAIEIIETPSSPIGWLTIWIIFAIIVLAIGWSIIGKVDEVAIARGQVIPDGKVKIIQTPESGIIVNITVDEGDQVEEGQILIELDNTLSNIDQEISVQSYDNLKLEKMVLERELNGETPAEMDIVAEAVYEPFLGYLIDFRMQAINNLDNRIKILELEKASLESTYDASNSNYNITVKKISILKRDVSNLEVLCASGSIPNNDLQLKKDELEMTQDELAGLKYNMDGTLERTEQIEQNIISERKKYREELLNLIVQKEKDILEAEGRMNKAKNISKMNTIIAPVSGQVNGLGGNAIGSVVSASTPIMTLVPSNTPMVIEASVANMDIGFINEGQPVDIKVDTFPFQKYGVIEGVITFVSPDAYQDENQGSFYKIKVEPSKETLNIQGKEMKISSGMTVTVEVKTGKRRIIEFFLPAADYIKESFELR